MSNEPYAGLIEDAENRRDGETAAALRRLAALEHERDRLRVALGAIAAFLRREAEYYGELWDPRTKQWRFDAVTVASAMSTLGIAEEMARKALGEEGRT